MKVIYQLITVSILVLFFGCKKKTTGYQGVVNINKTNIRYTQIALDSIRLDSINSSFVGDIAIFKEHIFFVDKKFSYVYKFSTDGKYIARYLGQGSGKNELPIKTTAYFSFMPNGNSIVIGPGWDCYIFDPNFKRIDGFGANWHTDAPKEVLLKHPDPQKSQMYSFIYDGNLRASNDKILFPVLSQHPAFNPATSDYAAKAAILGEMSLDNGSVRIFGNFSPVYSKDFNSMVFCYSYSDWYKNNNIAMTFAADPHLYIVDDDFNIIKSFGQSGRNMDVKYTNVKNIQDFNKNWLNQSSTKGHYTFLKYVKDQNLIFRGYHKGKTEKTDGLQIYKDEVLIGDLDVPIGFKVADYIKPYFYSAPFIDEDKGEIKIYKFKL